MKSESGHHRQLVEAVESAVEEEQGRWQKAIYELLVRLTGREDIDAAGCDSGDPLDFTLTEIEMHFNSITDAAVPLVDFSGLDAAAR